MISHLKGVGKSHRIALDPTNRQATLMMEHAGWARVAANWSRGRFQLAWFGETDERNADAWYAHVDVNPDGGEWLSDMDLRKDFNAVKADLFAWSGGLSQYVAKNAVIHMGRGLDAWGEYCKERKRGKPRRKTGFPPVRKRYRKLAFTPSNGRNSTRVDGPNVRLPRIGWVRMREELRFEGDILSVTVSRTAGRWFASFTVDTCEPAPALRSGPDIGIDMGVKTLATLWDGGEKTMIANPKALEQTLADLRATQKAIARSIKVNGRPCTAQSPPPLRETGPAARPGCPDTLGPPSQGHHANSQTRRLRDGGNPERRRDEVQPQAGPGDQRHRHGRVRAAAGVQVPLVRNGVPARGPLVRVLQDVQRMRCREAVAAALGTHLPVQSLWF